MVINLADKEAATLSVFPYSVSVHSLQQKFKCSIYFEMFNFS